MNNPGWNAGLKPNDKQKELKNLLLNRLTSAELNHLYDILTGQKQGLDTYYTNTTSGNRDDEFSTQLATQHQKAVKDFLYRESEQFNRNRINHSTLIKELTNQGIPLSFFQEHEPRYKQLLLLTYHALFDQPDFDHEYEKLLAKCRLFKENTGRTYTYEVIRL